MVHSQYTWCAAALSISLLSVSCGSGVGNAAPRVSPVPAQSTAGGGTVFSLDLGNFVSDPEGGPLVYGVVSGGGTFAGDMYSNMFATMGAYDVQFSVADLEGKVGVGTFTVNVKTANLAVVANGDNLQLLDTDTQSLFTMSGAAGSPDTVKSTLPTGHVIYERAKGTKRLFVYDPTTRGLVTLGDSSLLDTVYVTQTEDGRVVFTRAATATPADTDLYVWSRQTGLISTISSQVGSADGNAFATSAASGNLVFFQTGTPSDIYYFNPQTHSSTVVADQATAEVLRAVLGNDAVVYSRIGGGGELDLFYYTLGGGEVEIGSDLGATIAAQTKTYRGTTSTNLVIFEVTGATSIDLYVWDPGVGASTAIATNPVDDTFVAVTSLDEVVFSIQTGVGDADLGIYSHGGAPATRPLAATGNNEVYEGFLAGNGDVVYREEAGPDELRLFDTSLGTDALLAGGGASFDAVLVNDHVVYTTAAGVFVIDPTGGPADQVAGAGSVYGGEVTGGDFVAEELVAAQFDLVLWDESGSTTVPISSVIGDDTFGAGLANGNVLFMRVVAPKTTSDLFLWKPAGPTTTQITDTMVDHAVPLTFSADNN